MAEARLNLWRDVPGLHSDVTDANRGALDQLCEVMDGLHFFGHSPRAVQRETVRRLLSELRGEDVGVGW